MNEDCLQQQIEKKCDVIINNITFHESGFVSIEYDLNFHSSDIAHHHEIKKKAIKNSFYEYNNKKCVSLRIINSTIKKNKSTTSKPRKIDTLLLAKEKMKRIEEKRSKFINYIPTYLTIASMPHKKKTRIITNEKGLPEEIEILEHVITEYLRTLTMIGRPGIGLPYGFLGRLILSHFSNQVIINKSPIVELDGSLSNLMRNVGVPCTGGSNGYINEFKDQFNRVSSCFFSGEEIIDGYKCVKNIGLLDSYKIGMECYGKEEVIKDGSFIRMSDISYSEIIRGHFPIDTRIIKTIRSSTLTFDMYTWATYTQHTCKSSFSLRWDILEHKFNSNYKRARDFKKAFIDSLKKIHVVYDTGIEVTKLGITVHKLSPSILPRNAAQKKFNKASESN